MKTDIEKRASKFIDETDMMQFSTMEIMVMFAEKELAAINYTRCCESDSEQFVAMFDKMNDDDIQECINGFAERVYKRLSN